MGSSVLLILWMHVFVIKTIRWQYQRIFSFFIKVLTRIAAIFNIVQMDHIVNDDKVNTTTWLLLSESQDRKTQKGSKGLFLCYFASKCISGRAEAVYCSFCGKKVIFNEQKLIRPNCISFNATGFVTIWIVSECCGVHGEKNLEVSH